MPNKKLTEAKSARKDEFYTRYHDIEVEVLAYLDYNPDTFRGKTVLLPCDDPEWSNFTKFFAQNFERLGLKKLISTSYAVNSKNYRIKYMPSLFEQDSTLFDVNKTRIRGKKFILEKDITGDGKINHDDIEWQYLEGDGDFRSNEIKQMRDEADIIVTNPPFSLFREFMGWIFEAKKQFLVLSNVNAITYRDFFPYIMKNEVWLGISSFNTGMYFNVPDDFQYAPTYKFEKEIDGNKVNRVSSICWFTNLEHGRRHQPLSLMTLSDNLKFSVHKEIRGQTNYSFYDNYDAIECPYIDSIPSDFNGIMGVPITFLDKYCPEQFEIVGITKTWFGGASKTYPEQIQVDKNGKKSKVTKLNDGATIELHEVPTDTTYYIVNSKMYKQVYARILIRKKQES